MTINAQTYQNYKSALKWWHELESSRMNKVGYPWPDDVSRALSKSVKAYKRDIGIKKRKGVTQKEGKSPYDLHGYRVICKYFMQMRPNNKIFTWNEGIFASLFTKLSVNTIGRSDNIDDLLLTNLDWDNDAMTIVFGTTKADQAGDTTDDEKKRIFANPFMPEVCSILQLAIYVWCKHRSSAEECRFLFDGDDQNKRYYHILSEAVLKYIPDHIDLGCKREDIGTHSNRKFAESTSASKIDGPSRTQVCLRAGQGVGRTQDCYMYAEEDGDALVGRTVAQLKLDADEFDILPPHFSWETVNRFHEFGWEHILPGYKHYPDSFKRVIPYLLASLVLHYFNGNLARLLSQDHPLFKQVLFTTNFEFLESLRNEVLMQHYYCPSTHMSASGIPAVIIVSREVRELKKLFETTCNVFERKIEELTELLNRHGEELPEKLTAELLKRFTVQGVIPVTVDDIRKTVMELLNCPDNPSFAKLCAIENRLHNLVISSGNNSSDVHQGDQLIEQQLSSSNNNTTTPQSFVHYWPNVDEKAHLVPYGFKFPSYTVHNMWSLWFFGIPNERIGPMKFITGDDLLTK